MVASCVSPEEGPDDLGMGRSTDAVARRPSDYGILHDPDQRAAAPKLVIAAGEHADGLLVPADGPWE